jgi:hypothetical protein
MKDFLLNQAKGLGHTMVRTAPERYECACCKAAVYSDATGHKGWQGSKTGTICPEALVTLTPEGKKIVSKPELAPAP